MAQRSITARLLALAWPIALSSASGGMMTLVDTVLVGHLGGGALGGVGLAGMTAMGLLGFASGLLLGGKVLVAHAEGRSDGASIVSLRAAATVVALVLGALVALCGEAVALVIPHAAASPAVGAEAQRYLALRMLGAPAFLLFVALRHVVEGRGDSRSPMIASVAANAVNAALAWYLVRGAGLGVGGSALACAVAQFAELAVLWRLAPSRGGAGRADPGIVWRLLRMGLPMAIQSSLEMGAYLAQMFVLASLDKAEMSAQVIACEIVHIAMIPSMAVAEAACVLVGQAHGGRRAEEAVRLARAAAAAALVYAAACAGPLALAGGSIAAVFSREGAVLAAAARALPVAALLLVLDTASAVGRAVLRGRGDVGYAARVGVLCSWVFTPPLTWLFAVRCGLGATGAWMAFCAEVTLGAILVWRRFFGLHAPSACAGGAAHSLGEST
ncbi:MATE family efflux transporter [Sorangium sp. So ce834]|uniref:MATE family efflux transporter n=1 Tax=Sorangium sp. So ce834 TaxID=3133321 RepID=UPI003F6040C1